MLTENQIGELKAPLNANLVKKNPKGFDYIEGWHAIAEANRIFGRDGWSREVVSMAIVGEPYQVNGNWRVGYRATVRVRVLTEGREIVRDGTGYGSGIVKDLNDAHEGAVKEAETDAMKRALMTFGNPFGLALYDKSQSNVATLPPQPISDAQYAELVELLNTSGADVKAFCGHFDIAATKDLPAGRFEEARSMLHRKLKQKVNG